MCGIAGYISPDGKFGEAQLKKMTASLRHRGPDAEGFFFDEHQTVGLGHRRLSILDLSESGRQPFYSRCGRYAMAFNGEVYNFKEIARELSIEARTGSDTEIIIEAFALLGLPFLHKLNGMFAIAIWDKQEKKMHLFRDRIGIKPLLYYWDGRDFAFASEMKALLQLPIHRELNFEAIKDFLFLEYVPSEHSIFENIQRLQPGCRMEVNLGKAPKTFVYYDLTEKAGQQDISEKAALEGLEEHLSRSVAYQSISDVPIGAFLSGGTDSSLICSIFQKQNEAPIRTFTVGFDVEAYDESESARKVAAHIKSEHHEMRVNAAESVALTDKIAKSYDEPFAVPSVIPSMLVCAKAKDKATVALSGDGGDELFMGYGYYNWHDRIEKISRFGGGAARSVLGKMLSFSPNPVHQRGGRVIDRANPKNLWLHIWSQEQYMFTEKEIGDLFCKDYEHTSSVADWERIDALPIRAYEKISLFDLKNYLPANLLYKMDIASMASGLEVRVPLLDHNLVEFALALPLEHKIGKGGQKILMKKLLEKYLPHEMVYRKKWGFPAPVGEWLLSDLSYLIDKYLNTEKLRKQDIFSPSFIQKLVKEFRGGKAYHFKRVWALLVFQMWYEEYLDGGLFS